MKAELAMLVELAKQWADFLAPGNDELELWKNPRGFVSVYRNDDKYGQYASVEFCWGKAKDPLPDVAPVEVRISSGGSGLPGERVEFRLQDIDRLGEVVERYTEILKEANGE